MKSVLFDLDQTLLDRDASLNKFVMWQAAGMLSSQIADREGFRQRFIELDNNGRVWKDEVYRTLIAEFAIAGWSVEELTTSYELCFSGFCQPKQGVVEAVRKLARQGFKLGLVSNGRSPFQERNFNSLGIANLFDSVIVSAAVGLRKPDKAIFELAARSLGVELSQTVFVGDNPIADIQGARDAGMYGIYLAQSSGDRCDSADAVCRNFAELPHLIDNAS